MRIVCPQCHTPVEAATLAADTEFVCPSCGSGFRLEGETTVDREERGGRTLGRFQLLDTLGSGAFGTVYKARDPDLDRTVAVKVPRAGHLAGPKELDRFLREARSAAQLRHPSIVTVYEVGQQDGVPYLVSHFVAGVTLADLLSARRPSLREAAELVAAVADALQFAHEHGVVHRDVKPSNIMIGLDGKPCVMDFGLAKRDAGEVTMTVEGQVLGTPAYMPPEQAGGRSHAVDARGDVYSLGVVLYQLFTGELPFRGTARMLLHQVLHDEPRPPRSLSDHIPRDLETVCLKAMTKEPARRYLTARELADDLRRWLRGEPIHARPAGRLGRAVRWARRRPAAAALLAVSLVAVLAMVGLGVGLIYNAQLATAYQAEEEQRKKAVQALGVAEDAKLGEAAQRRKAEGALGEAQTARDTAQSALKQRDAALERAERVSYFRNTLLADLALKEGRVSPARQWLDDCKADLRNWEWRYLRARCQTELFSLPGVGIPRYSPDGSRIASVGSDGVVRLYDAGTGKEALALNGPKGGAHFSPDGKLLAVQGTADGAVRLFDARTGRVLRALGGPAQRAVLEFSPDGSRIAVAPTGEGGGVVRVFEVRTGKQAMTLQAPVPLVILSFSSDGTRLLGVGAISNGDNAVRVFDARTGAQLLVLRGPRGLITGKFSPDGTRIAACPVQTVLNVVTPGAPLRRPLVPGGDGVVRVYDARTGREVLVLKGPAPLGLPEFSPDGSRIAVAPAAEAHGGDGVVRVFDARTGKELLALKGPRALATPVFSPDGTRLAVKPGLSNGDGVVRVFDARSGQEVVVLTAPVRLYGLEFSPDGSRIAVSGADHLVRVYDARSAPEALALRGPGQLWRPVFSPDGARVAAGPGLRSDRAVRVYDARSGQESLALRSPAALTHPVFSPDGARIAAGGSDGTVRLFDARTGREALNLTGPARLATPVFSPDGLRLAVTPAERGGDGVVRIFDARTGEELLALKGPAPLAFPVYSPDGARLAVAPAQAGGDGVVRIYDARTGQELLSLRGPKPLSAPVFSPDGVRIAVAPAEKGGDGVVRVYDAKAGKELLALKGPKPLSLPVFSPDGTCLAVPPASARGDGIVRLFDARTGEEVQSFRGPAELGSPVVSAGGGFDLPAFSPDGSRIAIPPAMVGGDGAVRLFDTQTGQEILALRGPAPLSAPTFSPDGTRLAAGPRLLGGDGRVRVWAAPRDPPAWQKERRQAVVDGVRQWHDAQAAEHFMARQWFAAAFHLGRLLDGGPPSGLLHYLRGTALAHLARTAEADQEFGKALERKRDLPPLALADVHAMLAHWDDAATLYARGAAAPGATPIVCYRHALLCLGREDRTGYGKACTTMAQRFGRTNDAAVANRVAWACALGPDALADLQPAVRLAQSAVQADPGSFVTHNTLGAILYRAGRYQDAVAELSEAVKLNDKRGTANGLLFLAMAQHRLGKRGDARDSLERARQAHGQQPPALWPDRLEWQLLSREAEAMLRAGS